MKTKVINLDRRPDRWEKFVKMAENCGLKKYDRFSAIDGSNLKITVDMLFLFQNNTFNWRRSVIGTILSHKTVWQELVDSGDEYFLVLEDDVQLHPEFEKYFEQIVDILKKESYPFIFFDYTTDKASLKKNSESDKITINPLGKTNHIWGGFFAYIIKKDFAAQLLNIIKEKGITKPIDTIVFDHEDSLFITNPLLAKAEFMTHTKNIDSDIHYDQLSIFDDYDFYSMKDSIGNDLKVIRVRNFQYLKKIAELNDNCAGFNTYGYFKSKIDTNNLVDLPNCKSKTEGLYVKRKR